MDSSEKRARETIGRACLDLALAGFPMAAAFVRAATSIVDCETTRPASERSEIAVAIAGHAATFAEKTAQLVAKSYKKEGR